MIASSVLPVWVEVVDRFGIAAFLIIFGVLVIWKLLPHVITWFKASTRQATTVNSAVPRIERNLEVIANEAQQMKVVANTASRTEQNTDRLLDKTVRLESTTKEILDTVRGKRDGE